MRNRSIVLLCSALACITIMACSTSDDDKDAYPLDGTWTADLTVTTNPSINDFDLPLGYSHTEDGGKGEDSVVYTATDVSLIVNGTTYIFDFTASQEVGSTSLTIAAADTGDVLIFSGSVAGDTITGTYSGQSGIFTSATGTFTATR